MALLNADGEPLKLYRVTIEAEVYVLAPDAASARLYGYDGLRESTSCGDCSEAEIDVSRKELWIDRDWLDAIPYGDRVQAEPDLKVREVVERLKADLPDPRQLPLLEVKP